MWNGKKKAVTFSYDDGMTQDLYLVDIFNKYGLRATFNLNSGRFGSRDARILNDRLVYRDRVFEEHVRDIYAGHEVAVHTVNHPNLNECDDEKILREIREDRARLSELVGYNVVGMAYPRCAVNDHVKAVTRDSGEVGYSRTVAATGSFEVPKNLFSFDCTARNVSENLFELAEQFLSLDPDEPALFSVWGHSYEFDMYRNYGRFEEFCKLISGKDDIFYGTNCEVLLGYDNTKM